MSKRILIKNACKKKPEKCIKNLKGENLFQLVKDKRQRPNAKFCKVLHYYGFLWTVFVWVEKRTREK